MYNIRHHCKNINSTQTNGEKQKQIDSEWATFQMQQMLAASVKTKNKTSVAAAFDKERSLFYLFSIFQDVLVV